MGYRAMPAHKGSKRKTHKQLLEEFRAKIATRKGGPGKDTFEVRSEDISNVGGPMGSDDEVTDNWREYFHSVEDAKEFAEADFANEIKPRHEKINWKKDGKEWCSGDLRFVMYYIKKIVVG